MGGEPHIGDLRRAMWGQVVMLKKLASMTNGSFVTGSDSHRSVSHSAAVLQAQDKAL